MHLDFQFKNQDKVWNIHEEGTPYLSFRALDETGILKAVEEKEGLTLIDRRKAKTPEETREVFFQTVASDYFLMSTNAITMNGELVNIDGFCNRVACLCAGPEHVIVIAGMNKVVRTIEDGIDRIRTKAAPANTVRLNKNTPCAKTGECQDCYSPDCICSQTVITRRSGIPGRIKIILVNEDLGF